MTDWSETFDRAPASVARVRRFVLHAIDGVPAEVSDATVLMVSELATNVVRHVGSDYRVSVHRDASTIEVRVTDEGGGRPAKRTPTSDDPTGRGILIVETLSDAWGTDVDERADRTTVWFRVALSPAGQR